jgi:hypothetical protein
LAARRCSPHDKRLRCLWSLEASREIVAIGKQAERGADLVAVLSGSILRQGRHGKQRPSKGEQTDPDK